MFVKDVLNLARPFLVPRDIDLVFDPVDQVNPALFVYDRTVAGSEATFGGGRLRILLVYASNR